MTLYRRLLGPILFRWTLYTLIPCWTWPWGHLDQTGSPYNLVKEVFIAVSTVIYFFPLNAAQLYCLLDDDLGAVHGGLLHAQQLSHRESLCIPWTETPFLPLTHTARHSFLIRGGERVEYTSCCCWPASSKQEDLLGLITLASPFPPFQPITNKQQRWMAWFL